MKSTIRKLLEVTVFGLLLVLVTAPSVKPLLAQVCNDCVTIKGQTSAGIHVPVQVDSSGVAQTNGISVTIGDVSISGVSPTSAGALPVQPVGATYTFSSVSVTDAGTSQLIALNTARRALLIQNNSPTYNVYIGTTSPVTATSGFTLTPGNSFFAATGVPTNAFYALGTSSVAAIIQVGEGQ